MALIFTREGWFVDVMKWIAAAYLAWLAFQLIRSGLKKNELKVGSAAALDETPYASWKRGLLCNLLNPKVAVFLAAVTAPFLVLDGVPDHWPLVLWLTIVIEGMVLWCAWVCVLQTPKIRHSASLPMWLSIPTTPTDTMALSEKTGTSLKLSMMRLWKSSANRLSATRMQVRTWSLRQT